MTVTLWCNRVIRWGFYLLAILVPLILTPWNFELFEYNKMMLTYGLTSIIVGAWIVKMIDQKTVRIARTPLDIPIILFVLSQLVSSILSIDPHVSWFGYYSRFNGGMFSVLTYTALFYAFLTNFTELFPLPAKAEIAPAIEYRLTRLLKVFLTTAAIVAIYGVLERLGIDKDLWVQDVQTRVFSTLGQPNWLAAYLVAMIPLSLGFALLAKHWKSLPFFVFITNSLLLFVTLLFTRSRSGYVGLFVADIAFWTILFATHKGWKQFRVPLLVFHGLAALVVIFNGLAIPQVDSYVTWQGWRDRLTKHYEVQKTAVAPTGGTALEVGGTESSEIRKHVWQGAVNAWRGSTKNMLVGTGTETFAFAFYQYRPAGHNMTSEWDYLYNKAHNEFLNYLATTGLLGLGTYLFFLGAVIFWFVRTRFKHVIQLALFAGFLSILVTNFFGFSVVVMQLLLFLFPAIGIALASAHREKQRALVFALPISARVVTYGRITLTVVTIAMVAGLYRFWKADTLYASGNRLTRAGRDIQAQKYVVGAIALNGGEPVYRDELASILSTLAVSAAQDKNATLAAELARQSLEENTRAITTSPANVNFWKTRTKLYYAFSSFDPTLNTAAVQSLEKALSLSPNDPKIYYNLAILHGREGNNDRAIELLKTAKTLKPNYRDAYFGLYVFYTDMGKPNDARAILQEYLNTVNPKDEDFIQRLSK